MTSERDHRVDAVVVGGGVVGVSTALHLQRSGRQVALVERNTPGSGASGHNGGVINVGECVPTGTPGILRSIPQLALDPMAALVVRYRHLPRLTPWLTRFVLASRPDAVEEISIALQRITRSAMAGYRPLLESSEASGLVHEGGLLMGYCTPQAYDRDEFGRRLRRRRQDTFEILDAPEIAKLDPILAGRFDRAVYRPEALFTFESQRFTEMLAADFTARGGLLRRAEVTALERRAGRVDAVQTTAGRLAAETFVIAAGAWSRPLTRQLGLDVPLETERGYGVHLPHAELELRLPVVLCDYNVSVAQAGAGVQLTGIDELASVSAPPNYALTRRLVRAASLVFPELRTDDARPWMHCRPSMPDSLPVIGAVPGYPNAYLAFGHGHKGLGLAGITGQLVRELVDGEATSIEIEPYSPLRFAGRRRKRTAARVGGSGGVAA
jgi:D-amino-acid dehydrogenase